MDWSIGELALVNQMDAPGDKFRLTNGFLQPYSIHGYHKEKSFFEKSDIKVYPNPTKDMVEIDFMTAQIRARDLDVIGHWEQSHQAVQPPRIGVDARAAA